MKKVRVHKYLNIMVLKNTNQRIWGTGLFRQPLLDIQSDISLGSAVFLCIFSPKPQDLVIFI